MKPSLSAEVPASAGKEALGILVDELTARLQAGEPVDREAYIRGYPQFAEQLRRLLPALDLLADLGRSALAAPGRATPDDGVPDELLGTLGDFRLLREVGRGGMGVVYEAEQISLGRRVALKVLPFAAALDAKQLQRFKNEAQAAAHLQHTNIVPVHYVGCERGVHFYAMQYIEGRTLAAVIRELRQLTGVESASPLRCAEGVSAVTGEFISGRWAPVMPSRREGVRSYDHDKPTGPYCSPSSPPHQPISSPSGDVTPPVAALTTERSTKSAGFFRTVAYLGVQTAEALEHAHQFGIIHRDVKPANLLVDPEGRLWVTDFGLAHCQSQPGLTMTGDLLGTLRYMSPEQALGKRVAVDARTDVYSLGVTLYEVLTLEPAYNGRSREEVLRQITFEEPCPPSRLNKAVPAELETILVKAMAKNPEERYATAQELADDLQRYLEDKPIRAKRPSLRLRAVKWGRRHKTVVWAALLVLVLALIASTVSTLLIWQALEGERQTSYYQRIARAEREWSANDLRGLEELLDACPADLRGWEWHYLKRLPLQEIPPLEHAAAVLAARFSPDGRWIIAGSQDGMVTVWDATTGEKRFAFPAHKDHVRSLAISADGHRLATASWDGTAKVWDFDPERAGVEKFRLHTLPGHGVRFHSVVFSPDGRCLASAGEENTVRVWDVADGRQVFALAGHTSQIWCVAYSPDGHYLASTSWDKTVKIWNARTGREERTLRGHSAPVLSVSFSSDGQRLASTSGNMDTLADGEIKLWDVRTGRDLRTLRGHTGWVFRAVFSPDGKRLASAGIDEAVKVWDLRTGQELLSLRGHRAYVHNLDFSPDGARLLSACHDGMIRIWDATPLEGETLQEPLTLRGHAGGIRSVAFSPDGRYLASAGDDATVRIWDFGQRLPVVADPPRRTLSGGKGLAVNVAFSKDGRFLASGDGGGRQLGRLMVWDTTTWGERYTHPTIGCPVSFSPDGRLAADSGNFCIWVWDPATGRQSGPLKGHSWAIMMMVFSPDPSYRHLASAGGDKTVRIWDVTNGEEVVPPLRHTGPVFSVAFSSDGRYLASGGSDRTVKVWDARTGELLHNLSDPTGGVKSVAFHPQNDRVLAWGSTDGTVKMVKISEGTTKEVRTFHGHKSWVMSVAFSPDGRWIASASLDGTIKLWQVPVVVAAPQGPQ